MPSSSGIPGSALQIGPSILADRPIYFPLDWRSAHLFVDRPIYSLLDCRSAHLFSIRVSGAWRSGSRRKLLPSSSGIPGRCSQICPSILAVLIHNFSLQRHANNRYLSLTSQKVERYLAERVPQKVLALLFWHSRQRTARSAERESSLLTTYWSESTLSW